MNLVPAVVSSKLGRNALLVKKASPNLLFGVGIVCVVGGVVLACRSTLKTSDLLDETSDRIEKAKEYELLNHNHSSEASRDHDIALIRTQTTLKITKLYLPPVIVTGLGIVALTQSHRILTNRNAALTAAYATLDKAYREYRARVVDKYGEEQDYNFIHDTEKVKISGKEKKALRPAPGEPSGYARFWDEFCSSWTRDPEYNVFFLRNQQNWFNDLLRIRGHVFLNEVYDALGMERTSEGAIVGWVNIDDGQRDNFITFGVFEDNVSDKVRDFVHGREGAVLLDFNVDGIVYDLIGKDQ